MEKKLERNVNDDMVGGVASGLADYFDVDKALIRIAFVVAFFAGLSGVLIYVILWIALPARKFVPGYQQGIHPLYDPPRNRDTGYKTGGIILICLGLFFLLQELHVFRFWFIVHKLWPLAIIIPGIILLSGARKKKTFYENNPGDITWDKKQDVPTEEGPSNKDQSI